MTTAARWIIGIIIVIIVILAVAFLARRPAMAPAGVPAATQEQASPLDLGNMTYSFDGDTFALADGSTTIQGHAGIEGSAVSSLSPVGYDLAATTTGDVDGDGVADALAATYRSFGADIENVALFAFSGADGSQIASSTVYTYDSQVQSVSVADGVVTLDLLVVSEADRQDLAHYEQVPDQPLSLQFTVSDGAFVPVGTSTDPAAE